MDTSQINWKLKPEKIITEDQYKALLDAVGGGARNWMLLFTPGNTGLRISEVLHLRVKDIDRNSGIRVTRRKKKKLEPELLQVSPEFFDYIDAYVKEDGLNPDDYLFPGHCRPCWRTVTYRERDESGRITKKWSEKQQVCKDGGHLTVRRAEAIFDRALVALKMKMKGRGIHVLRHYDLTRFQRINKDLSATQARAGHANPLTTLTYAHIVDMDEKVKKAGVSVSATPWARKPAIATVAPKAVPKASPPPRAPQNGTQRAGKAPSRSSGRGPSKAIRD